MYDIIIVGAGPAGISAGIYAVSRGCRTLVLEQKAVGGIIGGVSTVTHYAGIIEGETGATFAQRMKDQALEAGVDIVFEQVTSASLSGAVKTVVTDQGTYEAANVILANGSTPRTLGIPGETELAGKGCGLNAARDGEAYRGKNLYVIGGADGAVKEALHLAPLANRLTLVCVEDELACIDEFRCKVAHTPTIEVRPAARLGALRGTGQVEELDLVSLKDGSVETIVDPGCGVFIYAGATPNTALYANELALENGYIPVNERMETALPGVYAAGDIRVKQVRQVATAVSDGAIAAINAAAR
ncbi:NAD(P)/FAD-dependent oxidoreductase [Eggerthella sinensis]|uniref:NAD(P)/FAD-dependent oxidoreductase n=1 Tax=Eggerthella sinensis TaxID=242230 RepID=UPI001D086E6F|nr:FAD-dependent oxidoreductase [Eggerthella sinensis]MCB7037607.1 FAD-dependent oxidoreductase [Eggerthella sinensis]